MSMLTVEECELLTDSKYRSYITQVEKALKSFEYTSEWADLISALGKLNKVLLSHLKYQVIPKKVTIGKRLAQCLHPALPSGVHLKALETYDIIFKCIGTQRLAHDLFIYSAGLFPLLNNSAMSVKPVLLAIYEKHFVALGRHIKPGLNGLLLGLLPGLEEGAEYFERSNMLLEDFCNAVGPPFFYTGIWECILSCPSVRLSGTTFLLNHLNKRQTMEDQLHMIGLDIDLMVSSICACLQDTSVLVQRSMLDFLLMAFPMHNGQLTRADQAKIVEAAVNVVLRRDMSLNRRLYAWLLGTTTTATTATTTTSDASSTSRHRADSSSTMSDMDLSYFQSYSKELLVAALKSKLMMNETSAFSTADSHLNVLKPFRILISLLDKPEIGPVVIESILLSVFRRLKIEGELYLKSSTGKVEGKLPVETLKTANLLFGSFEPYFIWDFMARMFSSTCDQAVKEKEEGGQSSEHVEVSEFCDLAEFLLDVIALDVSPETTTEHLPDLLHQIISSLTQACHAISEADVTTTLRLCAKLLSYVQPSMANQAMDGMDSVSLSSHMDSSSVGMGQDVEKNAKTGNKPPASQNDLGSTKPKTANDRAGDGKDKDRNNSKQEGASLSLGSQSINGFSAENNAEEHNDAGSKDAGKMGNMKTSSSAGSPEDIISQTSQLTESGISMSLSDSSRTLSVSEGSMSAVTNGNSEFETTHTEEKDTTEQTGQTTPDAAQVTTNQSGQKPTLHHSTSISSKVWSGHLSLMQLCVQSFQQFFHRFTQLRILKSEEFSCTCMQHLSLNPMSVRPTASTSDSADKGFRINPRNKKLCVDEDSVEVRKAYHQACRLLVDFASFPIYCSDYETVIEQMYNKDHPPNNTLGMFSEECGSLPAWLQDLLVTSCFVDCFELQSSSIGTMLDLISLTQSVQTESENKTRRGSGRQVSLEGRISVVILPALLPTHLVYINRNLRFYKLIAVELWEYLDERYSEQHQRAVELFHTLHQVTPSASTCEDVIGQHLISESEMERISAFKKFSTLWHLTRTLKLQPNPSRSPRTFDRSMFVVLDSLKEESSITKSLALTWLTHVIQRGDTSRVLQPLLLMLLHPDTARISIQHVNVHKPKKVSVTASDDGEDGDSEAKIYAISSEGGNVIYHLSQDKTTSSHSGKMSKRSKDELKSYAMTVMSQKGSTNTAPVRTHSVTDLSFERVNPDDVKLRINPFGSESSLDKLIFDGYDFPQSNSMPNLDGVKRLTSDTCKREGIFFDGSEEMEADDHFYETATSESQRSEPELQKPKEEKQEQLDEKTDKELRDPEDGEKESLSDSMESLTPEDIAQWVMDGVISRVVQRAHEFDGMRGEAETSFIIRDPSSSSVNKVFNSQSCDDLRRTDTDSTSGSDIGDTRPMLHDIVNKTTSSNSISSVGRNHEGSTSSLTAHPEAFNPMTPVDHRDLDPSTDIHELHMHILLYSQKYDYQRTLYALSTIRAMLLTCPRLVVTAMATTSISSVKAPHLAKLQSLLGRHRKSVFGKNFFGDLPPEVMSSYRSNMFVEIVISLCLYFVRGYYPNLMMSKLTSEELAGNKMVHILGIEILTLLVAELLSIMKDSGNNFVSYISDLLSRCKLQKSLLHCMLASVYNMGRSAPVNSNNGNNNNNNKSKNKGSSTGYNRDAVKLTELIIDFNENSLDPGVNDTFQMKLLQLMLVMIMLEDKIRLAKGGAEAAPSTESQRTHLSSSLLNVHYNPSLPIIQQEMFLSAVWSALKQHHQCHLHRHWLGLVTSAMPYMGRAMSRTVLCVVLQLCRNLETLASDITRNKSSMQRVPPDHVVSMLEGLTSLCHFCLLDNTSPVSIGQPAPTTTHISTETASAGQILTNLIHVFNPVTSGKEPSPSRDSAPMSPVLDARARLLSILPRIMACMATLWKAFSAEADDAERCHPFVGEFKEVRQHVLEFLSPISLPHGTNLLAAFAVAWNDRRQKSQTNASLRKGQVLAWWCEDQLLLVELVSAIKVLPTDTLIQTVKQVIKQPPPSELAKKGLPLEVNLLQFFYAFIHETASSGQLLDSWPSLLGLVKECLQMNLTPAALFLLLQILHDFVQKTPTMEEKKSQKDLQDICQKTLEAISSIAGSSLEQTTWLRRNFAVKPGPQNEGGDDAENQEDEPEKYVAPPEQSKAPIRRSQASDSKYSVQALILLAELTSSILDVIYSSEEKDKVAPFLTTVLYNVFPYLRHHSSHNLPSYRACSQLLSSISGYQYTRRAWRKEAFELLMEPAFFQMDARSISHWRVVIDNLMTHDKTTFKDLMGRVSITQSGSLNLFSSKEQEYEQRAQMLKRLAFTIFCSETDQYQRAMPDIQERLAESLRLPQVPNVMSQVFLCFRVLILRMSPQHLTSLWPTIITEMVQVLLQIEQELSTETDEFKAQIQRIAALDSSWAHLGNGLNAHNNPAWLQLYLSVCKLLDMCLVMPAELVPQFQLYRWAFIGTAGEEEYVALDNREDETWRPNPLFTPHIIRLSQLINGKLNKQPTLLKAEAGRPLLSIHRLRSLPELQSFFHTVCRIHESQHGAATPGPSKAPIANSVVKKKVVAQASVETKSKEEQNSHETKLSEMSNQEYMEHILEIDFLEPLS